MIVIIINYPFPQTKKKVEIIYNFKKFEFFSEFFLYFDEFTPYNPGFPMRAYEFGTPPFQGMFEVKILS